MNTPYPRNGLLSGMILPILAGVFALVTGFFVKDFAEHFNTVLSADFVNAFGVSILLMALHKLESYLTHEYDVCPVYLTNGQSSWGQNPRQAMFVCFVGTLLGLLGFVFLLLKGGYWPLLLLSVWMAQGWHEWHHLGKTLARRSYYSGVVTGLLFVAHVDLWVFPEWIKLVILDDVTRSGVVKFYYGLQPFILAAFYFEHRGWMKKCV